MLRKIAILLLVFNVEFLKSSGNPVKILSVDGGGIRGVIPAMILRAIEKKMVTKTYINDTFEVYSGTSTGALIVLMLNLRNGENVLAYTINDIVKFYNILGPQIFQRSYFRFFTTLGGMTGSKYSSEAIEEQLLKYFQNYRMSDLDGNVVIPAFNVNKNRMQFFRTTQARQFPYKDYYIRDIARATSAAPTYFEPAIISPVTIKNEDIFIDGGVGVNNPTISAVVYAIELYGIERPYFVLSIGCGSRDMMYEKPDKMNRFKNNSMGVFDWGTELIDILMNSVNDVAHYQALTGLKPKYYYRLQVELNAELLAMDNADPDNLKKLTEAADKYIKENDKLLSRIAKVLDESHEYYFKPRKKPANNAKRLN